jgi:DNA-binding SARP family transcriptional activator/tetratricopeptide (TPR) repeat protein
MPSFQLQSLGVLRLTGPHGELLHGRRRELVLLVHIGRAATRPCARQQLAELLWPGRGEARARQSLRQALYVLRSALGDALEINAEHVRLVAGAVELDATAFELAVDADRLEEAVARYEGEFLAGLEDVGGETYRAWLEAEREALRRRLAWSLERLVGAATQRRAWDEAVRWAERWASAGPFDETAHTRLVQALVASHRTAEAMARYAAFEARLREELEAQPSAAFIQLGHDLADAPGGRALPGSTALFAPDLVGRAGALAALDAAWQDAGREGVAVLVEGEEGIGRTRLCREFLRRLQSAGSALVLEAEAAAYDGATAGATARRLLAGLIRAPGLAGAPDAALAEVSALVPALRMRWPRLPEPAGGDAALAAALARVLEDVAAEEPVLVLLDDVSLADAATQQLIEGVAHRVPPGVLLLLTARSAGEGIDIGARLQDVSKLRRIKLQPLGEAELAAMLDSMLALAPADGRALAARLHAETGGNPLYTVELASMLADTGLLVPDPAGMWRLAAGFDSRSVPLPAGLRAAVLTRVEHLSGDARRLAEAAAVLGGSPTRQLLREVASLSAAAFAGSLDELLARRILRPPEAEGGGYRFTQELIRSVLRDALPAPRARALHRAALRATARHGEPATHLATHRERAALLLPGVRIWGWRHPHVALTGLLAVVVAAGLIARSRAAPPAPVVPEAVVVFPFTVQGDDSLAYAGQAVASLLATSIDGAPALRSVDPMRLLPAAAPPHAARGHALAEGLGAGHFVLGTILESRGRLHVTASLYDGGRLRTTARVLGESGADLFGLTDALARQLLTGLQTGAGVQRARVAATTTASLPAFKQYLAGENALRAGRYDEAISAFRSALEHDSTFALASHRMAVAADWRSDLPTTNEALERALRHRERLPERYQLLASADSARHAGAADDAERLYRAVITRHPDEPLAWYQLGEVLIHFNPLRGRAMSEARHAFERTLALESENYEARWHLAQLAVSARDPADLARWIEPLLAGADADRLVWRLLRSGLSRDAAAIDRAEDALREAADDVAYTAAWLLLLLLRDFAEGLRFAESVTLPQRAPEWRAGGYVLAAHAEVARARFDAALMRLDSAAPLAYAPALEYRALLATLPFVPASHATLVALRDELLRWDAAATPPSNVPHPLIALHDGAHEHLRLYLLGLVSARLGDAVQVRDGVERLRRLGAAPHAATFGADLALALEAELARLAGDPVRALARLDAMQMRPDYTAATFSPFYSHARERFLRVELLRRLGRMAEAERWYASVLESPPFGYVFAGAYMGR